MNPFLDDMWKLVRLVVAALAVACEIKYLAGR